MVKIKKTDRKGDFFNVRFRSPSQFERIRTPGWASRIADSISVGAEVRMGMTSAGNWLVQSVLIKKGQGKGMRDARRLAKRIQKGVDS